MTGVIKRVVALGVLVVFAGMIYIILFGEDIEQAALAQGDWGWRDGAGCLVPLDKVRIDGDRLTFVRADAPPRDARLVSRQPVEAQRMAGSDHGRLEKLIWEYEVLEQDRVVTVRDHFSVSYTSLGFRALVFAYREKAHPAGGLQRVVTERARGDRLAPCAAMRKGDV